MEIGGFYIVFRHIFTAIYAYYSFLFMKIAFQHVFIKLKYKEYDLSKFIFSRILPYEIC